MDFHAVLFHRLWIYYPFEYRPQGPWARVFSSIDPWPFNQKQDRSITNLLFIKAKLIWPIQGSLLAMHIIKGPQRFGGAMELLSNGR